MIKAVLFDLDGVITDSSKYHYLAWKMVAQKLGIEFDEVYNEKLKGVSRAESLELILQNDKRKRIYSSEEKEKIADEKNEAYKKLIQKIKPTDLLPGIKALLIDLRDNNIKTVVCSASKNANTIIESLKIQGYFDIIVDANLIIHSKPDNDIFTIGAYMAGVKPKEAVGIEDAAAGIDAIHNAGMKAIGIGEKEILQKADVCVPSTAELNIQLIQKLSN